MRFAVPDSSDDDLISLEYSDASDDNITPVIKRCVDLSSIP